MAKKFLVEIELKNFVLVELALDLEGQQHFTQFASEGVVGRQKETSCNLLGNGAAAGNAALAHAAGIKPDGPQGAAPVNAGVLVETVVFCGQEGMLELLRDLVESDRPAALFTYFGEQPVVASIHAPRHPPLNARQRLARWQRRHARPPSHTRSTPCPRPPHPN